MSLFVFILLAFILMVSIYHLLNDKKTFESYCSENGLVWLWDIYESLDYPNIWNVEKKHYSRGSLWILKSDNIKIYNETLDPVEIRAQEDLARLCYLDDFWINGKKTDFLLEWPYAQLFNRKICNIIPRVYERQCKEENQQTTTIIT